MQNLEHNRIVGGRYRLRQSLGKGSFGEVFYAEDVQFDPPRVVALKLLHPQFLTDEAERAVLRQEAGVLARFDHPNILRVIDFGVNAQEAYIVTELATGGSLARRLRPDPTRPPVPMPPPVVADYLDQIADALDDAHTTGLIHRDIKPQNILLDRRGRPLVADFGLATVVSNSSSSVMVDTSTSGTPLYMAPEQWQGRAGRASDIYALGAVVYQMLTGYPPYLGNQFELFGQHLNAPIPRLNERAGHLPFPPGLDEVLAAALAKDPHIRLKPANEFARRFRLALGPAISSSLQPTMPLMPIIPREAGSIKSDPTPATGPAATPTGYTAPPASGYVNPGPGNTTYPQPQPGGIPFGQSGYTNRDLNGNQSQPATPGVFEVGPPPLTPEQAPARKKRPGLPLAWLIMAILVVAIAGASAVLILNRQEEAATNPRAVTATNAVQTATVPVTTANVTLISPAATVVPTSAPTALTIPPSPTPKPLPTSTVAPTAPGILLNTLSGHTDLILTLAVGPDGRTLASGSDDGTVRLWDLRTYKELRTFQGSGKPVRSVAFSPDGQWLAIGSADGTLQQREVATGRPSVAFTAHTGPVTAVGFSPDGKQIASGSDDRTVRIVDALNMTGRLVLNGHTNFVTSVAFSPDGKMVVSGSADQTVRLWEAATGQPKATLSGHGGWVWSVAFAPDGKSVASGSFDKTVKVWDVTSGKEKYTLGGFSEGARGVAFAPDGKTLAAAGDDRTVRVWDLSTGNPRTTLSEHRGKVYAVAFSPRDSKTVLTAGEDKLIRVWTN